MCAIQRSAALIAERGGIFDISSIEARQLQLAWHAVGVFKGGVAAKRVSETNPPPRATPTRAPKHENTQMHAELHAHMLTINNVNDIPKRQGATL